MKRGIRAKGRIVDDVLHDQAEGLRRLLAQDVVRIVTVASSRPNTRSNDSAAFASRSAVAINCNTISSFMLFSSAELSQLLLLGGAALAVLRFMVFQRKGFSP